MKVSMNMLADALAGLCEPGRLGGACARLVIEAVMPYEPGRALAENMVYVVHADAYPLVPAAMDAGGLIVVGGKPTWVDACPCDYLVAHESASPAFVLSQALLALGRYRSWYEQLTEELVGSCDLNKMCSIGSELLERTILIYDKNYNVIGNSIPEDESSYSVFLEKRSSYYATRPEPMMNLSESDSFAETFRVQGAALHADPSPVEGVEGGNSLYVNIGKGAVYQGRVVVPFGDEVPRPGDYQIAELFCDIVRLALRRPTLREADLDRVFRAYFASLLEGRARDDRFLSDSLRLWNWQRRGTFVCLWAELDQTAIAAAVDAFLCYRLEMELPGCCAVRYEGGIACVAPIARFSEDEPETASDSSELEEGTAFVRRRFESLVEDAARAVGASEVYEDILLTNEYFTEARVAAGMCERFGVQAFRFADVAMRHYHEFGCSQLPAVHFCDADVKRLMKYRGMHKDFYAVLKCYLEHNMNLLRTSEALFVHRTTLFNYLKEIRSIISCDLDDPEQRLRMLESFRIMARDEEDPTLHM